MKTTTLQKLLVSASAVLCAAIFFSPQVSAMHIMEGYLNPGWAIAWGVICVPFVVWGCFSISQSVKQSSKNLVLLAMCGAFAFVLSALKIPSVSGSCSHPTGVGLGAILFGPAAMSVIGVIILLFQALLLAHGGISTLGANTFSMAIAGPLVSFGIFKLCKKLGVTSGIAVFLAAALGDLFTYLVTSVQLALDHPDPTGGFIASFEKFAGIFAVTQIPLAICEGLLTVVIYNVLVKYSRKELESLQAL